MTDTFTYNGLGLRVGKTDSTGTYAFACDGSLRMEYGFNGPSAFLPAAFYLGALLKLCLLGIDCA